MAVSLLVYSCTLEQELGPEHTVTTNKKAEVILRLKTPSDYAPASRSLTYKDENTISDVYVLVFDKDDKLVKIEEGKNVSSSAGNSNPLYSSQGTFSVTLGASKTETDTYKLVVLANAKTIITNTIGFDVSAINNNSYSDVIAAIWGQISSPMYASGGTIPMWGESGQLVVSSDNSSQSLQLTRALARIDVGVGKATKDSDTDIWSWDGNDASGTPIPFELKHVYIIKPNNRYTVVPDITKAADIPTVPNGTTAFSLSDSESKFVFDASLTGHTSRDIYIPEADIKMATSGKPGDDNHTNRMAIVVGGCYNSNTTETFYRIDFAKDGSLMNALRNHLYQFNISKVSGDGYPDVETAYKSRSMNMAVDINEWDETDMGNIVFDGQNTLSVSQDEYYFSREEINTKGEDNILYIKTDYKAPTNDGISGWYVEKIVDEADKDVTWVSLSPDHGDPDEKTEVVLMVEENNTGAERSAIIWIAAGRLRYPITVTQSFASAISIQILDEVNQPIEKLVFLGKAPIEQQSFTVNWEPKTADVIITSETIGGNAFPTSSDTPQTGVIFDGNGTKTYTFAPPAYTDEEINNETNPFIEKISIITFTITNGLDNASASIYLRQKNYNLVTDVESDYVLSDNTQQKNIHVRANFDWIIKDVDDPYGVLVAGGNNMLTQTGGNNTSPGDVLTLMLAKENGSNTAKTATIIIKSLVDDSEWPIRINTRSTPPQYVGYFGGELKKNIDGEWQFERKLYVQSTDESMSIEWSTDQTATGIIDDTDGKGNTLALI